MKKIWAVFAAILLVACLFAGCNGADGGKVTDSSTDNTPVITTAESNITTTGNSANNSSSATDAGMGMGSDTGSTAPAADNSVTM